MKHILIFASGTGSNAENIILHFSGSALAKVAAVFSNKADAGVLEKAQTHAVDTVIFTRDELLSGSVLAKVGQYNPDLIVLAGFLLKFPEEIIAHYPRKIINIHPALLPKYGGKGMYGMNVHRAVLENNEPETGITIHYVDAHYDEGDIIFQKRVSLTGHETCQEISEKVRQLEHDHFPQIVEKLLK